MNTKALALISAVLALSATVATASDTKLINDFSPEHFMRHNNPQANASGVNGREQAAVSRPTLEAGQVPTQLLPRELQWMNRPQNPSNGGNR